MTHVPSTSRFPLQPRQIGRLLIGILGSVATLWWVWRGVNFDELGQAIFNLSPGWFGVSLGCAVGGALFKTVRWRALYGSPPPPIPFGNIFSTLMIAQATNVLLPIRLGELIRLGLMRQAGQPSATTLTTPGMVSATEASKPFIAPPRPGLGRAEA